VHAWLATGALVGFGAGGALGSRSSAAARPIRRLHALTASAGLLFGLGAIAGFAILP